MNLTWQIAKQFRDVYFGGNWTSVNLKENLADVTWQQAITKVYSFNTIAALVYRISACDVPALVFRQLGKLFIC